MKEADFQSKAPSLSCMCCRIFLYLSLVRLFWSTEFVCCIYLNLYLIYAAGLLCLIYLFLPDLVQDYTLKYLSSDTVSVE
jgi:hypothetical protein